MEQAPTNLSRLKAWLSMASNREMRRLRSSIGQAGDQVIDLRLSFLRALAIRTSDEEWAELSQSREALVALELPLARQYYGLHYGRPESTRSALPTPPSVETAEAEREQGFINIIPTLSQHEFALSEACPTGLVECESPRVLVRVQVPSDWLSACLQEENRDVF